MSAATYHSPVPSNGVLSRLVASINRLLMTYAEITIRNGDISRCVL